MEDNQRFAAKSGIPLGEISIAFPQGCDEDFENFVVTCAFPGLSARFHVNLGCLQNKNLPGNPGSSWSNGKDRFLPVLMPTRNPDSLQPPILE